MKILIILTALLSITTYAMTREEIEGAIQSQMNQRHPNPPSDFWESLGPEAPSVLKSLMQKSTSPYEQSWLIDGLSHFSDPSIGAFLQEQVSKSENAVTKKKLLGGLIRSQGDQAYDFVEPFLKDSDPHIRLAVAQGMKNDMDTPRAKNRVAQYQASESEAWIKKELAQAKVSPERLKKIGSPLQQETSIVNKPIDSLAEKDWAGEWSGIYFGPRGPVAAHLRLTKDQKLWRARIDVKKGAHFELKSDEIEVSYSKTDHTHWMDVRNKKEDARFVGKR